jgi:hypothetical protein
MFSTQQNSGFDPRMIPGCIVWLDGADTNTITPSTGGNLTAWNDKSGSNNHINSISSPAPSYSPITKSITFASSTPSFLRGEFGLIYSNNASVFVVNKYISNASITGLPQLAVLQRNTTNSFIGQVNCINQTPGPKVITYLPTGGDITGDGVDIQTNIPITNNTPYIFANVSTFDGTDVFTTTTFSNGNTSTYSSNSGTFTPDSTYDSTYSKYALGNAVTSPTTNVDSFNGDMYECIMFSDALTISQRQQVEGYLAWKWGLQSSLPVGHTFKNNPVAVRLFKPIDIATPEFWFDIADLKTLSGSGSSIVISNKGSSSGGNLSVTAGKTASTSSYNNLTTVSLALSNTLQFTGAFPTQDRARFIASKPTLNTASNEILFLYQNLTSTLGYDSLSLFSNKFYQIAQGVEVILEQGDPSISEQNGILGIYTFVNSTSISNNRIAIMGSNLPLIRNLPASGYNTSSVVNYMNYRGSQELGEFISYNIDLTVSQSQQVEGYLAWKWGVQSNLSDTHPYRNFRPTTPVT